MQPDDIEDWEDFLKDQGCDGIVEFDDWIMLNCIFHNQSDLSRPSMGINKDTGIANCFGCGFHSWSDICEVFGISSVNFIEAPRASKWEKFRNRYKKEKRRYRRYTLPYKLTNPLKHKGSKKYLIDRNKYSYDILCNYGIKVCLDRNSKYNEHIIFPILDNKGVLFFDGRYVGDIEGKNRWVRPIDCAYWKTYFNWVNVKDSRWLIFVEGASDVLKFAQFGLPAIPAKNFSDLQYKMILDSPSEVIWLSYDNDDPGRYLVSEKGKEIHFTAKALNLFCDSGKTIKIMNLPDYSSDPADVHSLKDLKKVNYDLNLFC